jgi:hypothetical protein
MDADARFSGKRHGAPSGDRPTARGSVLDDGTGDPFQSAR